MHKILVIRLYFPLDALHVLDFINPSSGATFMICTSHLVRAGTSGCRVAIAAGHNHKNFVHLLGLYAY